MIIAMRAHATKPDAPPKLICLMMSGRGRCPHLRSPDKRGSTVLVCFYYYSLLASERSERDTLRSVQLRIADILYIYIFIPWLLR